MNTPTKFIGTVRSITDIPNDQIEKILALSVTKKINAGECFIQTGQTSSKFAFVEKGLFRYYYILENGNEFTKAFFLENSFISSYSALIQNRESYFTIEALEDSTLLVIDHNKWKKFLENELCWNKFLIFF